MTPKYLSYGEFLNTFHKQLKPKGIRLGQALSTTFLDTGHQPCTIAMVDSDDEVEMLFLDIVSSCHLDICALEVKDHSMLNV